MIVLLLTEKLIVTIAILADTTSPKWGILDLSLTIHLN